MLSYLILPLSLLGIISIAAMGLQLILGGAGLLTLGHTAFFAMGGYASAAFVIYIAPLRYTERCLASSKWRFVCFAFFCDGCIRCCHTLFTIARGLSCGSHNGLWSNR